MNPEWLTFDVGLTTTLGSNLVFDLSPPKNSYSWALAAWIFLLHNDYTSQHRPSACHEL